MASKITGWNADWADEADLHGFLGFINFIISGNPLNPLDPRSNPVIRVYKSLVFNKIIP